MKILLLIIGSVCCLALAEGSKQMSKNMRMLLSAKRSLEKKQGPGHAGCYGAKCQCSDRELLGAFVGTMGNLVATCEISRLWQSTTSAERRSTGYDFYEEGCNFLADLAVAYENGDLDGEIFSCCEVNEGLAAFHCLNTYMTLAEMRFLRIAAGISGQVVETSKLVTDLEVGMEYMCNSIFHNPTCLVMGLNEDPNIASCADGPPPPAGPDSDATAAPAPDASVVPDAAPARKSEDVNQKIETLLRTLLKKYK